MDIRKGGVQYDWTGCDHNRCDDSRGWFVVFTLKLLESNKIVLY